MISSEQRRVFDRLLDEIIGGLPGHLKKLIEEVPIIVEDRPGRRLLEELDEATGEVNLCGLHSGVALTDRSVLDSGHLPEQIMLFRQPIMEQAGYSRGRVNLAALREEIRVTLLHEIGHHFGLDEEDLDKLGYG